MKIDISFKDPSKDYFVYIDELKELEFDSSVAIVTNQRVGGLWLKDILPKIKSKNLHIISIPDGEEYKSFETLNYILEQLFIAKLDRKSTLISFGGGVVSDLTGFAASIYQRGISFINIPTTLLAQVDASVGGKTGINTKFGKNLIGSFYQPKAVYCESKYLQTLPNREFSAGVAEAIKMAIMFDRNFFQYFANHNLHKKEELAFVIKKCVELKADIVSKDEKESGIRSVLNYGHTFAHVIENETKYLKFLHGEAVSIGMNMANLLALKLGYLKEEEYKRIKDILIKFNLPVYYKIKDKELFYESFFLDKKSSNSKVKFILPNSIGNFIIKDDIDRDMVISVLSEFA
ncbi:3-dehydroquinate synthase [Campylobacter blaseri]|uniref:3-dehydroquinate synthase n=1 Tax=Campylobacter blaseri TaxID=2042961 RepID=A0A2P8R2C0_9BACT|nr:3-dehydroquinate synthase [Campylobacter blaseri]PSM52655.1 3-dehydroquinate synthase [Campylobacter blaseri]PSM54303.1 3-dehydroquinate synthase [Campylobacter blaseri]QKF85954.1 3-dehydroquinate synthase [Campylobacter blaseri]